MAMLRAHIDELLRLLAVEENASAHTVRSHIKNCYRKLQVHSAAAAVMRGVELRILGEGAAALPASWDG